MGKKKGVQKTFNRSEIRDARVNGVEQAFLLSAMVLHDYYDFDDNKIVEFWERSSKYSSYMDNPKITGITVKYVLSLLKSAGIELHITAD